jgi:pSer/pThr/pTyr-binding forkhead associated (FHA) protein
MSLKSFLKKVIPGKKTEADPAANKKGIDIQYEMPFEKLDTRIETIGTLGEIDIYVNDEKTSIHPLGLEAKIGRDPAESDIVISELIVSKLHCTIYCRADDYYIKDNNSTNGTYVNNQKVTTDRMLENDDLILLGKKGTVKIIFHKKGGTSSAGVVSPEGDAFPGA